MNILPKIKQQRNNVPVAPLTYKTDSTISLLRKSNTLSLSFIIFLLMLVFALILGRAYCGWVCPAAGCQEAIFLSRDRKITNGDYIKWIIWIPWISTIVILAVLNGGYHKIDFFYDTSYGLSIGDVNSLVTYFIVLFFLIVFPAYIFGKRSFCHHICWMAPFMIIGRKFRNRFEWPSLQLQVDPEKCKHCHTCIDNCPMSLPVEDMVAQNKMENTECILCGTCIDGCKYKVINYSFLNKA